MTRSQETNGPTQGQWTIESRHDAHYDITARGYLVCRAINNNGNPQNFANAHLIAAAPDLLALAKKLAGECSECHGRGYTFSDDGITGFGPDDREPTREACADCADIREVIAKAVLP